MEPQNALLPYKVPPHCLIGFYFNTSDGDYQLVRLHSFGDSVTLEETLFWVAMEVSDKVSNEMIISFNTRNNELSKIELPPLVKDCAEVHKKLAVYKDSIAYEDVDCWCKLHTIGMFSGLERPVGVLKNEILMSTDRVIHSVGGSIALLPEDDLGAEFSYNVFNYVENFITSYGGNLDVEEGDPVERKGVSLHDLFISSVNI
ncbi:hypothetical protein JHK82_013160 [Glycine max]|nr:hypothetical protein JHK82_013160 [Glycine max]